MEQVNGRCKTCDYTPAQAIVVAQHAEAKAAEFRNTEARRVELKRRADLVINSTRGLAMTLRMAAAMELLWACHWLSAPKWDERFERWRKQTLGNSRGGSSSGDRGDDGNDPAGERGPAGSSPLRSGG
jgi:hypothetical protein